MKTDALVLPHDPNWNEARRAWNLAVDQQPTAVALPESALLATHLGKVKSSPAKLLRHTHREIPGLPQVLEILVEEPVFSIVAGAALRKPAQQLVR